MMKTLTPMCATMLLFAFAPLTALAQSDELDDLDATMEVVDDPGDALDIPPEEPDHETSGYFETYGAPKDEEEEDASDDELQGNEFERQEDRFGMDEDFDEENTDLEEESEIDEAVAALSGVLTKLAA